LAAETVLATLALSSTAMAMLDDSNRDLIYQKSVHIIFTGYPLMLGARGYKTQFKAQFFFGGMFPMHNIF
jgi:hypothetical protein